MKNLSTQNFKPRNGNYIFMPGHPKADEHGYVNTADLKVLNDLIDMMNSDRQKKANRNVKSFVSGINYQEANK